MDSKRRQAEELFHEVADLPRGERQQYLDRQNDVELAVREEVRLLLESHEDSRIGSLRELDDLEQPLPRLEGSSIGPYKILQLIGEGGFGAVYMAEQESPLRRRVALKLIKLGMDTRHVIGRFEAERQALAMMDHPNIARVFDAGATDSGRPYFVMELVKGIPITDYCDANRNPARDRLKLFQQVCRAVQHAHQKGIIHRDIKPSNILITILDGAPVPKVIDFGIARATDGQLTDRTIFTRFGEFIGTPQYMSPEQAVISGLDVDTRADIYSLGVLLYELLTSTTPFDPKTLQSAGIGEMQRIIREVDPLSPSRRLSTLGIGLTNVAKARQVESRGLNRLLRGELDWIVMKALEKDRRRRYETAESLAADVQRYLDGEPILARPPSKSYRLRKLVGRHRAFFTLCAVLFLFIIGFGIWMTVLYSRADQLRQQAEEERVVALVAEQHARDEKVAAERISDFLVELFQISDPTVARGETITAIEILDRGAEKIRQDLRQQPAIQSALLHTMGRVYTNLGLYRSAAPLLESAYEVRRQQLGEEHPETVYSMVFLGRLYMLDGRFAAAELLLREALIVSKSVLGRDHRVTVKAMKYLAWVLQRMGRPADAEPLCREALETSRRVLGEDDPDTFGSMQTLAWLLQSQGKHAAAEQLCRDAVDRMVRMHGRETLPSVNSSAFLGVLLLEQGQLDEAEELLRECRRVRGGILGDHHLLTMEVQDSLGETLLRQGRLDEAEVLLRAVAETYGDTHGESDPRTAKSMVRLGRLYLERNDPRQAEPMLSGALEAFRSSMGTDASMTFNLMPILADVQLRLGRAESAKTLITEYLSLRAEAENELELAIARSILGACHSQQGQHALAEPVLLEAHETLESRLGIAHEETRRSLERIVQLYDSWGRTEQANSWRARNE